MDFVHLVESGEYKEETLSPTSRAFVSGMRHALESVKNFKAHIDEGDSLIGMMLSEYSERVVDGCLEWLKGDICEAIVSLNDDEGDEDDEALPLF